MIEKRRRRRPPGRRLLKLFQKGVALLEQKTCRLRSIFVQVHAPDENDSIRFAAYRRQTLRGFVDELTKAGDAAPPGGVSCVCAGGKGCYDCFTEGFSFSAMTHSTTVRAMSGRV